MIERLSIWLGRRKQAEREQQIEAGYAWAAGKLLAGRRWLVVDSEHKRLPVDTDAAFDLGAMQAIRDWRAIEEAANAVTAGLRLPGLLREPPKRLSVSRAKLTALAEAMVPF